MAFTKAAWSKDTRRQSSLQAAPYISQTREEKKEERQKRERERKRTRESELDQKSTTAKDMAKHWTLISERWTLQQRQQTANRMIRALWIKSLARPEKQPAPRQASAPPWVGPALKAARHPT